MSRAGPYKLFDIMADKRMKYHYDDLKKIGIAVLGGFSERFSERFS